MAGLKLQQPKGQPGGGVSLFLSQPPPFIYCSHPIPPPLSGAWAGCRTTCSQTWPDGAVSPHVTGRHRGGGDCGRMGPGTVKKVEGPLPQSQLAFLFILSGRGQGSQTIAPHCLTRLVPPFPRSLSLSEWRGHIPEGREHGGQGAGRRTELRRGASGGLLRRPAA